MDCTLLKSGLFIFHFESEEAKTKVLDQTPWPFTSKMLFPKPWTLELDLAKDKMKFAYLD